MEDKRRLIVAEAFLYALAILFIIGLTIFFINITVIGSKSVHGVVKSKGVMGYQNGIELVEDNGETIKCVGFYDDEYSLIAVGDSINVKFELSGTAHLSYE